MNELHIIVDAHAPQVRARGAHGRLARATAIVACWWQRSRSRDELAEMDERMLSDIGATTADAWRESRKPFWQD